jgi:hypothetical protein
MYFSCEYPVTYVTALRHTQGEICCQAKLVGSGFFAEESSAKATMKGAPQFSAGGIRDGQKELEKSVSYPLF